MNPSWDLCNRAVREPTFGFGLRRRIHLRPEAGRRHARCATLRLDGRREDPAAIGAVGVDLAGIVGKRGLAVATAVRVALRDGDTFSTSAVSASAPTCAPDRARGRLL